ncbi:hypothetical protein HDZ31DRAFT_60438 [Schizophyllum fasciatum]
MLSSLISYRPKRKTKGGTVRSHQLADYSTHPYASPELTEERDSAETAGASSSRSPSTAHMPPSAVAKLSLDLSRSPLDDCFPDHMWETSGERAERKPEAQTAPHHAEAIDEGSEVSSSEEIVASLEAMTASTFIISPPHHSHADTRSPAPLRISLPPKGSHSSHNDLGGTVVSHSQSGSPVEDAASVRSGITLARALFSSSFALSDGERHASTASSILTRHDSATLASGEHTLSPSRDSSSRHPSADSRPPGGLAIPPPPAVPPLSITPSTSPAPPLPAIPPRSTIPPHLARRACRATSPQNRDTSSDGHGPSRHSDEEMGRLRTSSAPRQGPVISPLGTTVPPAPPMPPDTELLFSQLSGILSPPTSYAGSSRAQSMLSSRTDSWQSSGAQSGLSATTSGSVYSQSSPSRRTGSSAEVDDDEPTASFRVVGGGGSTDTRDTGPTARTLLTKNDAEGSVDARTIASSPSIFKENSLEPQSSASVPKPSVFSPPAQRAAIARASLVKVDSQDSAPEKQPFAPNTKPVSISLQKPLAGVSPELPTFSSGPMKPTFTDIVARMDFRPTFTPISEEGSLLSLRRLSDVLSPASMDAMSTAPDYSAGPAADAELLRQEQPLDNVQADAESPSRSPVMVSSRGASPLESCIIATGFA